MADIKLGRREPCPSCGLYFEKIRNLVNEQAEDEGLWFTNDELSGPINISEAYLQLALRKLHAVIEGIELK